MLAPVLNGDATRRGGDLESLKDSIESIFCRCVLLRTGGGRCRSSYDRSEWDGDGDGECGVRGMLLSIMEDMMAEAYDIQEKNNS